MAPPGSGFQLKGPESQMRGGRSTKAESLLAHTIKQTESSIIRSEKSRVDKVLLNFLNETGGAGLATINSKQMVPKYNKEGVLMYPQDMSQEDGVGFMTIRADGKEHKLTFPGERGKRISEALKNVDGQQLGPILKTTGKINRFLSQANTSWNPGFTVTNAIRDVQTAAIQLQDTPLQGKGAATVKDAPMAYLGIYRAMSKDSVKLGGSKKLRSAKWSKLWEEFRQEGGKVGWADLHSDVLDAEANLKKMLDRKKPGAVNWTKDKAVAMGEYLERLNMSIENAVRLSAYHQGKKQGLSKPQAAKLARELTVDFNRGGSAKESMNALYMFANAGVQGSTRTLRALKNRKVQAIAGSIVATGFMLDQTNRMMSPEDEEGNSIYDAIPDHVKERNLIIVPPGSAEEADFYKIPLPYGWNVPFVVGSLIGEHMGFEPNPEAELADTTGRLLDAALGSFIPVDLGSKTGLVPSVARPFAEIAINEDWKGSPIQQEENPFNSGIIPDSHRPFKNDEGLMVDLFKDINEATGGDEFHSGAVDVSGASAQYILEFAAGGAGKFLLNTVDTAASAIDPEKEMEAHKVPFVRKVKGKFWEGHHRSRYYELKEKILPYKKEFGSLDKADFRGKAQWRKKNKVWSERIDRFKESERDLRKLRKAIRRPGVTQKTKMEKMRGINAIYKEFAGAWRNDEKEHGE